MVSVGRGRGWAQNDKDSLARPGRTLFTEDTNYMNIVNIINLVRDDNLEQKVEDVLQLIIEEVNKQKLKDISDKLYKHALNNLNFGLKLFKICNHCKMRDILDSESRSLYLHIVNHFQLDYTKRKELKQESPSQFHNAVRLFSKFLNYAANKSCQFPKLQEALLDYMEMLLDTASVEDIKIFTEQLLVHGRLLQNGHKEKLDNLMTTAKQTLVKEDVSTTRRLMLLYAAELESRNFKLLPANLERFYESQLGENFVRQDTNLSDTLSKIQSL